MKHWIFKAVFASPDKNKIWHAIVVPEFAIRTTTMWQLNRKNTDAFIISCIIFNLNIGEVFTSVLLRKHTLLVRPTEKTVFKYHRIQLDVV